jgi:hypothetical protein
MKQSCDAAVTSMLPAGQQGDDDQAAPPDLTHAKLPPVLRAKLKLTSQTVSASQQSQSINQCYTCSYEAQKLMPAIH